MPRRGCCRVQPHGLLLPQRLPAMSPAPCCLQCILLVHSDRDARYPVAHDIDGLWSLCFPAATQRLVLVQARPAAPPAAVHPDLKASSVDPSGWIVAAVCTAHAAGAVSMMPGAAGSAANGSFTPPSPSSFSPLASSIPDLDSAPDGLTGESAHARVPTSSFTQCEDDGDNRWTLLPEKRRRAGMAPRWPAAAAPLSSLRLLLSSLLSYAASIRPQRCDSRLAQLLVLMTTAGFACMVLLLLALSSRDPSLVEQAACGTAAAAARTDSPAAAALPSPSPPAPSSSPPLRVLLVMTDNRELEDDADSPLSLVAYANWLYSRLQPDLDFLYVRQSFNSSDAAASADAAMPLTKTRPACYDGVLQHQRAASWCKLQVLYRLMAADAGRHDVLFFLDSDAVVSNYDVQLESWLSLIRVQGCSGAEFQAAGSPCSALFFTNDWARFLDEPEAFHLPNAGVWLLRLSSLGRQLVQRWWHQSLPDYNLHHPYEQIGLWQLLDSMTPEQRAACTGVIIEPSMRDVSVLQFVQHRSSYFASTRLPSFRQLQQRIVSDPQFAAAGIDTDFSAAIAAIRQRAMSVMDLTRDEVPAVSDPQLTIGSWKGDRSRGSNSSRQKQPPRWTTRLHQIRHEQRMLEADQQSKPEQRPRP